MALDKTMKTILIYVWRGKYKITCDQVSQMKWETAWSQVNWDIVRDSFPAQDIIQ